MSERVSTKITLLSSHFEPYSELEMRCLTLAEEVRKLEDKLRNEQENIERNAYYQGVHDTEHRLMPLLNEEKEAHQRTYIERYNDGVRDTELRLNVITEGEE